MRNFAEIFGNEPDRFFRGHPIQMIESRQSHRTRIASQGPFAAQVEVDIEIAHGQFAQVAIHRMAIKAYGEIGFCHCAPMAAHLENRNDMISILFCFQIEDQWWESQNAKRSSAKNSAFETGGGAIVQDSLRRSGGITEIVRQIVEKFLYASGGFQCAQPA